jgi:hypothetical protein
MQGRKGARIPKLGESCRRLVRLLYSIGGIAELMPSCREHNMIRFKNGVPDAVWYSQHANGQAFKYSVLEKSGLRVRLL